MRVTSRRIIAVTVVTLLLGGSAALALLADPASEHCGSERAASRVSSVVPATRPATRLAVVTLAPGSTALEQPRPRAEKITSEGRGASGASGRPTAPAATTASIGVPRKRAARIAAGAATPDPAPDQAARASLLTQLIRDLHDSDPGRRMDALALARDYDFPEVMGEVKRLAFEDPSATVRRFAVQALALDDDVASHEEALLQLHESTDWTIRANAAFGLARLGSEPAQQELLALMQSLEATRSPLASGIARAVASPELRSAAVMAYFEARSTDLALPDDDRAAAGEAYMAKFRAGKTALAAR